MSDPIQNPVPSDRFRRPWGRRSALAAVAGVVVLSATAGAAGANYGFRVRGGGNQGDGAELRCDGGMSRLSHVFDESANLFEGDPPTEIEVVYSFEDAEGFLLEKVSTGVHTSTHLDAPGHFIEGGRTVDELEAEDLVWPAYVIDVRQRMETEGPDFLLSVDDIRRVERRQGKIPPGAMVIIRTGFEEFFGTPAYENNVPGFDGATVQWLFDKRRIGGTGSDTFGPDATIDETFGATYTTLLNDGIALPGLNNLESLNPNGDLIMAGVVPLVDGSGYQVDPLACHSR